MIRDFWNVARLALLVTVGAASMAGQTIEERKTAIKAREDASPSEEAAGRKARSLSTLSKESVPTLATLPVIEDSKEAKCRNKEELADRAIATCLTAVKGEGLEQKLVEALVKKYGADTIFSPKESAFIKDPRPSERDRVRFAWRYEAYWVLLWTLGYVDSLDRPDGMCDVEKAVSILHNRTRRQFIADAKLRPLQEILGQADLAYRYHWAIVDARIRGIEAPAKLSPDVVLERHYVLNWIIGHLNQSWDEISTDT